jgi:DNA-binding transcriptional LysR family regulator
VDLRLLKTFEVVASFMNFNRAAQALACTQSTVSAQIKSLEDDLGVPVFDRLGRRIALTPAGEALLRRTRRLLSYESEVRAAVNEAGETAGLLALRIPQSVSELHLPMIFQTFCAQYPRVGFDVANCGYHHLPDELRTGEIDAGFLLSMPLEAADLCTTEVHREKLALVASPTSPLAKLEKVALDDLGGQTLVLAKHDCAYRMKLEQELDLAHIRPAALLELNSTGAVIACAAGGVGLALVPEGIARSSLTTGALVKLSWNGALTASLYFIRHRDKPLVGAFGAFVTVVEQYFVGLSPSPG